MMGATPEDGALALVEVGADIIGANCGNGIENFLPVAQRLRAATSLPIWIKANAGLPQVVNGETVYPTAPAQFAAFAPRLVEAGAKFIGGCCGSTPEHIRALRSTLDKEKP